MTTEPNKMPAIPHTNRHANGMYKVNLAVPKKLQEVNAYDGKKKIVESLRTRDYEEASLRAAIRVGEIKQDFARRLKELPNGGSSKSVMAAQPHLAEMDCLILKAVDANAYVESLLKDFFLDELSVAEAEIEELCTLDSGERLDDLLGEARQKIDLYRGKQSQLEGGDLEVDGKELLKAYLIAKDMPFSERGLQKVSGSHDKFRRAQLEVTNRKVCRILDTQRPKWMQGRKSWVKDHDPYFRGVVLGTRKVTTIEEGLDLDTLAVELSKRMQPVAQFEESIEVVTVKELCESYLEAQEDKEITPESFRDCRSATILLRAALGDEIQLHELNADVVKMLIDFISSLPTQVTLGNDPEVYREKVEDILVGDMPYDEQSASTYIRKLTYMKSIFINGATF